MKCCVISNSAANSFLIFLSFYMYSQTSIITSECIDTIRGRLELLEVDYIVIIHEKTGLSRVTIARFFTGQKVRPKNAGRICDAALELLESEEAKQYQRLQKLDKLGIRFDGKKN